MQVVFVSGVEVGRQQVVKEALVVGLAQDTAQLLGASWQ
jgi:hypothetical protein